MKKLKKKGAFGVINAGMISFLTFMLVAILVVLLINVTQQTSIVCKGVWDTGACVTCSALYTYNSSGNLCCNTTFCPSAYSLNLTNVDECCNSTPSMNCTSGQTTASAVGCTTGHTAGRLEYDGSAYNATKDLMNAGLLPPQFAQIIVIVVIIVGILGMLTALGYGVYRRMER